MDCGKSPPPAAALADGDIVHYWFEVEDTHAPSPPPVVRCTDPAAHTVDWRLTAESGNQPAAVLQFLGGPFGCLRPGRREAGIRRRRAA